MPVIVNSTEPHPFLPTLGSPEAMDIERARKQDIRPLEIAIFNLMADKLATERQLAEWLGKTPLQVNLTFVTTDSYVNSIRAGRESKNTPSEHIINTYKGLSEVEGQKFDGAFFTGVNALEKTVAEEKFYPEVQRALDWSATNAFSSVFLCWGAKAALKHFHDIESHKGKEKLFGLFGHERVSDSTGVLDGLPDVFSIPVSRWKSPLREDIRAHPSIEIVADSKESGPNILVESKPYNGSSIYPSRLYVLSHPEYDTDTLGREYARDNANGISGWLPMHYFPNDDTSQTPPNTWRHTAHIYTNWLSKIYRAVPYDFITAPGVSMTGAAREALVPGAALVRSETAGRRRDRPRTGFLPQVR